MRVTKCWEGVRFFERKKHHSYNFSHCFVTLVFGFFYSLASLKYNIIGVFFFYFPSPYFWVGRKCRILSAAVFFDAELYVLILAVFVNSVWLIC